jgi:hypothetical protein
MEDGEWWMEDGEWKMVEQPRIHTDEEVLAESCG